MSKHEGSDDLSCDVAIIGAGTAGLAAERAARAAGARTLLIDEAFAGTTCASVGCMPSKLLIAAATAAHAVRQAGVFGIEVAAPVVNGASVMARVQRERDRFVAGAKGAFEKIPAGVMIRGRAHFVDSGTLELDDGRRMSARAVVIATGSSAVIPPSFHGVRDVVLTNETVFELERLPTSIAVIGAGPVGLELAQALARLGVRTAVFDQSDKLAVLKDDAVAQDFLAIMSKEFPITLGVELSAEADDGGVVLSWRGPVGGRQRFDRLLLAAGRPARVEGLGLACTGVDLDAHGVPYFDRRTLQCGDSSLFIAGDANHDRTVLHEAAQEGTIAGRNAAAFPRVTGVERMVSLALMFTDPPVAVIGDVPAANEPSHVMGCASYADQGRAKVFACNAGLVHLYADPAHGRLTGASMVGPGVEHSAHLLAWAIQKGLTATDVLDLPFYHPTFEEGLKPALRAICHGVHASRRTERADDMLPGG